MATRAELDLAITDNINTHKSSVVMFAGKYQQVKQFNKISGVDVHVYEGPAGSGYSFVMKAVEGKKTYLKIIHFGPETRVFPEGWTEKYILGEKDGI